MLGQSNGSRMPGITFCHSAYHGQAVADGLVARDAGLTADSHGRRDLQAISLTHESQISMVVIDI